MKRKIGFVAAVILVGVFVVACNQKPAEPASTPAPSPTPAATEEPATTPEPSPSSQPVEQVTEEQTPTNEGAAYESDPSQSEYQETRFNELVNKYMTKWGFSQEEAEKMANDIMNAGQQAAAEEQQRLAESSAAAQERIEQEFAESAKATNDYYLERYGITKDQAMGMSPDELRELRIQKHGG